MNRARRNHTVGVAGGVLSLFGLCLGILSVGNKGGRRNGTAPVPSARPKPQSMQSLAETQCEPEEALEPQPVPVVINEAQQLLNLNAGPLSSREMIADRMYIR